MLRDIEGVGNGDGATEDADAVAGTVGAEVGDMADETGPEAVRFSHE